MESGYLMERLTHFAHPQHPLVKSDYDLSPSRRVCNICEAEIAGLGYSCHTCSNFDIHEACNTYFKEDISFFAHPGHALTLARTIDVRACDLCTEQCPGGTFMYRCAQCGFDVHPLCTLLPQTIHSPLHPAHVLNMVPAQGHCSVWHYPPGGAGTSQATGGASRIGRFLLRAAFRVAVEMAINGMAPDVLDVLQAAGLGWDDY